MATAILSIRWRWLWRCIALYLDPPSGSCPTLDMGLSSLTLLPSSPKMRSLSCAKRTSSPEDLQFTHPTLRDWYRNIKREQTMSFLRCEKTVVAVVMLLSLVATHLKAQRQNDPHRP